MRTRSRLALAALAALATGTFAIGMTEFVITGLLPDISADFAVSIPAAGLLISGYAISVLIGGPLVVLITFGWTAHAKAPATVTLFLLGVAAYATVPGLTTRVLTAAGDDGQNLLASSSAVSAFNLGNAAGAYLGGRAITAGWGYDATPWVGAAMEAGAIGVAIILISRTRRESALSVR